MKNGLKRLVIFSMIFCFVSALFPLKTEAASFQYKYKGNRIIYTGVQPTVKYNNKKISLTKTPAILINDIAMVPYYEVFYKGGPKVQKAYDSKTKVLTLTYNDKEIKMTLNKKTAYVNGTAVTLPVAPRKVTYVNTNRSRILVPSRKVCEYLGLAYSWNASTKVVSITGPTEVTEPGETETKVTYYINGVKKTTKPWNVTWEGTGIDLSTTPALNIGGTNMVPYNKALCKNGPQVLRRYNSKTKVIELSYNGNILTMQVGSTTADLNGVTVSLPTAPCFIKYNSTKSSNVILVPIKAVANYLGIVYSYTSKDRIITLSEGLSIKYDGNYQTYGGTQNSVYVNSTKVSMQIPAIQIDDVWYVMAKSICQTKYGLGVTYSYKSKKATLTDGINEVVMNANSTSVTINGATQSMPNKARLVYLTKKKTNYFMVPAEYFCNLFGLGYSNENGTITLTPATKIYPIDIPETSYTKYSFALDDYAKLEYNQLSSSYQKQITLADFTKYVKTEEDTTDNFKYLRLDTYRQMKTDELDNLIASNSKGKKGILNGQAEAIDDAAKKYKIDPVAFAMQCIHETGWGTSTLSMGITSDVVAVPEYNSSGEITGFKKSNGEYVTKKLDKSVKAYNLFGIKAYDDAAQLCGFSYAYYMGWTSIEAAIEGGAKYISENYIHNSTYKQNTFYKFRFNPNTNYIWHQYATDPGYAEKNGVYLKTYKYLYATTATFQYDYPEFLQ